MRGGLLTTPSGIELLRGDIQILSSGIPKLPAVADTDTFGQAITHAASSQRTHLNKVIIATSHRTNLSTIKG